ncbi:carbohydrate kinase [Halocynthiibacter sp. C4]|uniref:carbohydrate kinase family protein n=1 Tax=Halocynthiibacter sp. C4 TaxID=2992758 RepID=UPI00237A9514|nr:carbohydrate kinase [Halocynthiibacter sp. C4]MDE0591533.1 carbohydrate kinase [Halocynthiibacter sp. C4]
MILCCGEALIDMVPDEEGRLVPHSGGAIFNTAIALGRLGAEAGYFSGLSTDLFGAQLEAALGESNVDTSLTVRSDRPTTLAFVKLTDGHAEYTFYDENTAGRSLTPEDLPTIPESVNSLYFGGISLISEPAASAFAALCARESGERVIMIDPNIRAGFIKDRDGYVARVKEMIAQSDIVKVSDEDLDWLVPGAASHLEKLAELQATGPSVAVLTRGAQGPVGRLRDGRTVEVKPPVVTVKDTVGAGDTFNAGFLAKLDQLDAIRKETLRDLSLETLEAALDFGARVAAVTVTRAGANPPWASEL